MIQLLAGMSPPWTLTGGGALVGYHLAHRTTRDLDLFWHGETTLGRAPDETTRRLEREGFLVTRVQSTPTFVRLDVNDGHDTTTVDLVADPVATVDEPVLHEGGVLVDTAYEILVNKLTTLLSRSELRDLEDIRALVEAGGDLERALKDAIRKDGGFSRLTLAWLLRQAPLHVATKLGFDEDVLRTFRDELIVRLVGDKPDAP